MRHLSSCRSGDRGLPLLVAAGLVVATLGCGDGKIARHPVRGKVTIAGKPVEGAMVYFCPVGGSDALQKERPVALTDAAGDFQLTTFVKGDGAPAGDYKVMIRGGGSSVDPRRMTPEQAREAAKQKKLTVPPRYGFPDQSGLTATVAEGDNALAPFDLMPGAPGR
ncbi:MAG: hypothetical protein ACRCT8_03155 [Lacipirellulaceae bacterium]